MIDLGDTLSAIAIALGLSGGPAAPVAHGYVEGEFLRIAAPSAGTLQTLAVARGEPVTPGAPLFAIDQTTAKAERDRLSALVVQAKAQLADLQIGRRPEEIDAIRAQQDQADAAYKRARADYARQQALASHAFAAAERVDSARADYEQAAGKIAELQAQLATARLPSRPDQIRAAEEAVHAAEAALAEQNQRLRDLAPLAPTGALVENTYYNPGEWVPAGATVVSLLAPERIKLVVFVPETQLSKLKAGVSTQVSCDGCAPGTTAKVVYRASQAEYTPPVIYSVGSREKLVYRVELKPERPTDLPIGLPVDVELPQ